MRFRFHVLPYMVTALLFFLILPSGSNGQMQQSRFSGGQALIRENSFDFGKVPQRAKVSKIFYVINEGTDTLEILKIKPGCGCTKAPVTDRLVAPGDSTIIEIIFSSGRRRGTWAKSTQVFTSDLLQGVSKLRFSAQVYPEGSPTTPILAEPTIVETMTDLTDSTYEVSLKNLTMAPLGVSLAYTDDEYLDITVPKKNIEPGERANVKIRIKDDRTRKSFQKSFTLQIDDAKSSRLSIPVRVYSTNAAEQ